MPGIQRRPHPTSRSRPCRSFPHSNPLALVTRETDPGCSHPLGEALPPPSWPTGESAVTPGVRDRAAPFQATDSSHFMAQFDRREPHPPGQPPRRFHRNGTRPARTRCRTPEPFRPISGTRAGGSDGEGEHQARRVTMRLGGSRMTIQRIPTTVVRPLPITKHPVFVWFQEPCRLDRVSRGILAPCL